MEPKYSILYFKENLDSYQEKIGSQLRQGLKVFWFGTEEEVYRLKNEYKEFADAYFLQAFVIVNVDGANKLDSSLIGDGIGIETEHKKVFDWLENSIPQFNAAQYRVEHCAAQDNIVVKASAGTGKTTVMIDRILYLMHTVPNLDMSEIYMITFTNAATNQMNDRLQEMLLKKYALTKNQKYLNWLEQQSQMHISTIDSLALDLFRSYGTSVGYGRDLQIRNMEKERTDIFKDILSENLNDKESIYNQIGMSYSEAEKLIKAYWKDLTQKGYSVAEVLERDWGSIKGSSADANFQEVLKKVLVAFDERYRKLKLDKNAISINDLFFDFGHLLLDEKISCNGLIIKYLFVDEFQDTDVTQIKTFVNLVRQINACLFVVGDIKQSIYGFKGATDAAFDLLEKELQEKLKCFNLRNNYRTCANIMCAMEKYFYSWSDDGLIRYEESVRPFNSETGSMKMEPAENKNNKPDQIVNVISEALNDLEIDVRAGKKVTDKTKVAVLVRWNSQAYKIAELCRNNGINVVLSADRPFFRSDAVRDFYAFISSFIFVGQPIYMYNYLMTPYADLDEVISIDEIEKLGKEEISEYLKSLIPRSWYLYEKDFRIRPVLSVVKDIFKNGDILERYIAMDKADLSSGDKSEAGRNAQVARDARQYQRNLDKLMEILQQRMDGDFTTLYDLYVYLSLMISSNREELEPDVELNKDHTCVYVMTVHKAKGLEFDTVILPEMGVGLDPSEKTTVLVNDDKFAWYNLRNKNEQVSAYYKELREEYCRKGQAEQTRILYVAMTRAINKLILIVNNSNRNNARESWSSLIGKVGLINE